MLQRKNIEKADKFVLSPEQRVALLQEKIKRAEQSLANIAKLKHRLGKQYKF